MSEKGIIAAWMSPARLCEFTMCNQLMNIVFLMFKYMLVILNMKSVGDTYFIISEETRVLYTYLFRGYGAVIVVLGITLIVLSTIGKLDGIDRKRTKHLLILGVINLVESIYFMVEVML